MFKDLASPLRPLVEFRDEITLVPFSGVQMLDFGFNIHELDLKPSKFIERLEGETGGVAERSLKPLSGDPERDEPVLAAAHKDDQEYSIRPVAALEPFLEKWVPVPVLRLKSQRGPRGEERFDPGPSSWARLRTV
ncbi:MAG: virulence factor SrfB, partial [Pseudomonadota bacterium]